jgi:hypothetical protein
MYSTSFTEDWAKLESLASIIHTLSHTSEQIKDELEELSRKLPLLFLPWKDSPIC